MPQYHRQQLWRWVTRCSKDKLIKGLAQLFTPNDGDCSLKVEVSAGLPITSERELSCNKHTSRQDSSVLHGHSERAAAPKAGSSCLCLNEVLE